ncbi:MAG TPA: aldehyde dehydrogenase family protein [Sphingomonas sp.]|nr:aldehyde dehydrogenase family protein [Sphingomonas sp.]
MSYGLEHRLLINGQWRETARREASLNPSDLRDTIGDYCWAGIGEVEEAIVAARRAQQAWSRSNVQMRADLLLRAANAIYTNADALAELLAREEGKVRKDARGEVIRTGQIFHFYSGETVRRAGGHFPSVRDGFNIVVEHEPVGVVALITPWNFPFATAAWKIAAALAYGNSVLFKPSEFTPACGAALTQILVDAGVPAGVFNLLHGAGAELGEALIDGTDAVSFTGSTPTGRRVLQRAALNMKKVQLELGGKSPLVVLDDADLDQAAQVALDGAFYQTGQRCTASSRLIATRRVHDAFVEKLTAKVQALSVGHALADGSEIGPVATEAQLAKDLSYVEIARNEGAELMCGGERLERPTQGYYLAPALFVGVGAKMRLAQEEVFGPVAGVIEASDLDEALAIANDSEFALSSAICTTSLSAAEKFRRNVRAGMVVVNAPTSGAEYHVPFGGRSPSGYGAREQGAATAEFFTETKTAYINHGVI